MTRHWLYVPLLMAATIWLAACGGSPPPAGNNGLIALFTATPASGAAPLAVQFSASSSRAADGDTIVSYAWQYGDGDSGSGLNSSHTYTAAGSYTVTLTINDSSGNSATAQRVIAVSAADGGPGNPGEPGGPDEPGEPGPGEPGPGEPPEPDSAAQRAVSAVSIAGDKRELQLDTAGVAFEVLLMAAQLNGGNLVVSGTLTQTGANSFAYSEGPTDRLIVQFQNGNSLQIAFTALDGNLEASSPEQFLRAPHQLQVSVTRQISGVTDSLTFTSQRNAAQYADSLQGEVVLDGERWTINLSSQGTYRKIVDVDIDYEHEENITGTVAGNGLSASINEYYRFRYLLVDNAVENVERRINTSWTYGGENYQAQDLHIRRAYNNGVPAEFDYWRASGNVVRNGAVVGSIGSEVSQVSVDIFLLWNGERYLIHRDLLP